PCTHPVLHSFPTRRSSDLRNDINVIWDLAPHDVSILLYLLGKNPDRIRVQAHAHLQPHIQDIAYLDLGYADGMTAHIHVSWLHRSEEHTSELQSRENLVCR